MQQCSKVSQAKKSKLSILCRYRKIYMEDDLRKMYSNFRAAAYVKYFSTFSCINVHTCFSINAWKFMHPLLSWKGEHASQKKQIPSLVAKLGLDRPAISLATT